MSTGASCLNELGTRSLFKKKIKKKTFNSRTGMGTGACCLKELGGRRSFTAASRAYSCSLMWVYMCPHAMILYIRPDTLSLRWTGHIHARLCEYICGLMLLYILYVSSYYYVCVRILLYMCPHALLLEESYYNITTIVTIICVSSYYYMCPHTTICVLMLSS